MMRFDVVTIFPEMFEAVTGHGITRRALEEGGFDFRAWNPRDFVSDPHRTVDDRPYGGGPGMVMLPGPLEDCIDSAVARQVAAGVERPQVVLLSPQGERFTDAVARQLAKAPGLVLLAGRYEGVDERLIERRTCLIVAHRLSTIRRADRIIVIDHGRIVESGTHEALLSQSGHYAALHREFVRLIEGAADTDRPDDH